MFKTSRFGKIIAGLLVVLSLAGMAGSIGGYVTYSNLELDRYSVEETIERNVNLQLDAETLAQEYLMKFDVKPFEVDSRRYDPRTSNIAFKITKEDGTLLSSNYQEDVGVVYSNDYDYRFFTNEYTVTVGLHENLPVWDEYKVSTVLITLIDSVHEYLIPLFVASFVALVWSAIYLFKNLGHKKGHEGIYLNTIDKLPIEILSFVSFFLVGFLLDYLSYYRRSDIFEFFALCIVLLVVFVFMSSVIVRIKAKTLWSGSLTKKVYELIKDGFNNVGLVKKGFLVFIGLAALELVIGANPFWWVVKTILLGLVFTKVLLNLKTLETAGEVISLGNVDYKVDSESLLPVFQKHADDLNRISTSVDLAVKEQLKSDRMKTELITNVSHDIKTPLTSIINYVDLLSKEDLDNETAVSYLEPLNRQSLKLSKLVDDLMVISSVSTGDVDINLEPMKLNVLIEQTAGEFVDRLTENNLELVVTGTDEVVEIMGDSQLMSRTLDNLITNVLKYSLPGTRAYLSLEKDSTSVSFVIRNISKELLTLTGPELMERFVRGDSSRNTSGNGLGLSIAKSMVELQGGRFELIIDGDLFKVICSFDSI